MLKRYQSYNSLKKGDYNLKKIINQVNDIVPEMVSGLVRSSNGLLKRIPNTQAVIRNDELFDQRPQVGLVSGGGSGHEPLHAGFVGAGMLSVGKFLLPRLLIKFMLLLRQPIRAKESF